MGFKINVNTILRQNFSESLIVGKQYSFAKDELSILADDIQIWLTAKDWTVLADIQVTSQKRENGTTTGTFVIKYLYTGEEQRVLTEVFRRMYGWE